MSNMTAKFPSENIRNARNLSGEKEIVSSYTVTAYYKGEFYTPVRVACYMGKSRNASTLYASVWVSDRKNNREYSGFGSASGYGYHKESAAIEGALTDAGIELRGDVYGRDINKTKPAYIGGCGDSAVRYALEAVARKLGYRKFTLSN